MKSILTRVCTIIFCATFGIAVTVKDATAQNASCGTAQNGIIPIRAPVFDATPVWKKILGAPGPDIAANVIPLADGGEAFTGMSAAYNRDKGQGANQLYLARLDKAGKPVWEKRHDIKGLIRVRAGVAIKDRIAVISQTGSEGQPKSVRLNFFDGLGKASGDKTYSDPVYDLMPVDLVVNAGSQSLTAAIWAVNRKRADDNFTIVKKLSTDGQEISSRQYLPGVPNRLESLSRTASGDMIGAGHIRTNGVQTGWLIAIDGNDGDILFQRSYSPGVNPVLRAAVRDAGGDFVAVGDTLPKGEGNRAAWVMKVTSGGAPLWQRFIKGGFAFSGRDVIALKDNRSVAGLNARPAMEGAREHVRVMTFSANGNLLGDDAYQESGGAQMSGLLLRENGIALSGVVQSGLSGFQKAQDQKTAGFDFWLMNLMPPSDYSDPCAPGRVKDGFDDDN